MEEEYKKKYEELVKHIKHLHQSVNPEWKRTIESYVPEIKENGDERIRKAIFKALSKKDARDVLLANGIQVSDALAWLEKQGHDGKKWIYEDIYLKEREQLFQDGIDEVLENPQKYGLEKQGEQKLLNNDKYQTVSVKILDRLYESEKELERLKQDEQKWSEEDEDMLNSIIATCKLAEQDRDSSPAKHLFEMQTNWLKSLKERMKGE